MGDIIACEPIVRSLRRNNKYSSAYIIWAVKKSYKELLMYNPNIDKVIYMHCISERFMSLYKKLVDNTVDLHCFDRYCSLCTNEKNIKDDNTGISLKNFYDYGGILNAVAIKNKISLDDYQPKMYLNKKQKNISNDLNVKNNYIIVHCLSNNKIKDWDREKWIELCVLIKEKYNYTIVEVGINPLIENDNIALNYCGKLSLLETASIIEKSEIFIGVDSGPAHMANSFKIPGIILLGKYIGFEKYIPYTGYYLNNGAELIHANGFVSEIKTKNVFDKFEIMHRRIKNCSDRKIQEYL
ncbi:MAG: glycosyltransferase family 9 protein [Chlorobium sp.]|nr:MAG: glycosyltransferase family 9 protein [Chlorobium sp.]